MPQHSKFCHRPLGFDPESRIRPPRRSSQISWIIPVHCLFGKRGAPRAAPYIGINHETTYAGLVCGDRYEQKVKELDRCTDQHACNQKPSIPGNGLIQFFMCRHFRRRGSRWLPGRCALGSHGWSSYPWLLKHLSRIFQFGIEPSQAWPRGASVRRRRVDMNQSSRAVEPR